MMKAKILGLGAGIMTSVFVGDVRANEPDDITIVVTALRSGPHWGQLRSDEFDETLPGITPVKLLRRLPGASQTGADDFGAYEWGNDINVRGFTAGQIGWMLDDIPLGSTYYWYNSGLDLHRAISTENIDTLSLLSGSGTAALASYNALGAGVVATSEDPATETGGMVRLTAGSHRAWRGFARADSGLISGGGRGFFSLSTLTSDKWKGMSSPGQTPFALFSRDDGNAVTGAGARWGNYHDQLNAKWVQPLASHQLTFYANLSDKRENDYADLTVADYRRRGHKVDNWTRWSDAISGNESVYFGSAMSWRRDTLLAATLDLDLGSGGKMAVTPYHHRDEGNGDWHMPTISDDGSVSHVVFRRSKLDLQRQGVNLRWRLLHGGHHLSAGLWAEKREFDRRRHAYGLVDWRQGPEVDFGNIERTLIDRRYTTQTQQWWLQDRYTAEGSPWSIALGGKVLRVENDFHDRLGVYADRRLVTNSPLLPSAGLSYRVSRSDELFANVVTNINAKPETVFTQAVYDGSFKPERSRTLEAGWRHISENASFNISAYDIDYRNRLLQIANCSLLGTCPSLLANVGKVTSRGVELRWQQQIDTHWSWAGSASYNAARYRNDYLAAGKLVKTKGKQVVNTPSHLLFSELRYRQGAWSVAAEWQYSGRRPASYTNDLSVPGYSLWHLSGGWEMVGGLWGAKRSGFQWQVRNVFDKAHISTLGASGYFASDPAGTSTYVQTGSPRGVFLTLFADY
jgi:iron complex outermembrane receptor protein